MLKSDLEGKSMITFLDIDDNGIEHAYLLRMVYCQAPIVAVTCEVKKESEKKTENQILSWTDSNLIVHIPFRWQNSIENFKELKSIESRDDISAMIRRSIWKSDKPVTAIYQEEISTVIDDIKDSLYAKKGVRRKITKLEQATKKIFAGAPLYKGHEYSRVFSYMARLKDARWETQKQILEMIREEISKVVSDIDRITTISIKIRKRYKIGGMR